ncbi:MAG: sulfatase-like hydrolase/transferase [Akkermansiaceae bacterium]|nr:sulfatase-like hydrolase/transferase [Akkermansiaceae bacterium]
MGRLISKGALVLLTACVLQANPAPPNIVLILTDDMGWNALSIKADPEIPESGSSYYQTPNTDQLAESGIRFSMAYSAGAVCDPSRTSIQYGMTPTALKKFATQAPKTLPPTSDAMVSRLKTAYPQYKAAHFGKWHQRSRTPEEIGFDESDGQTMNEQSKDPKDPKMTRSLTQKANAFMEKQVASKHPFFLQVSFYANHLTYQALPETIAKYEARSGQATQYQNDPLWAAMNEELDTAVGAILGTLDKLGIAENTYIIYTADNGYEFKRDKGQPVAKRDFYKSYPLRSHKYVISEGGIRVPFIIRGPGIPAGISSSEPVVGWDILPTVLDMAGASKDIPKAVEGGSLLPLCTSGGKTKVIRRDPFMVFRSAQIIGHGALDVAIIQDGYKFYRELESGKEHLWSLRDDPGESKNLLQQMPERAGQLRKNMDAYCERVGWDQKERAQNNRPPKSKARSRKNKKSIEGRKNKLSPPKK